MSFAQKAVHALKIIGGMGAAVPGVAALLTRKSSGPKMRGGGFDHRSTSAGLATSPGKAAIVARGREVAPPRRRGAGCRRDVGDIGPLLAARRSTTVRPDARGRTGDEGHFAREDRHQNMGRYFLAEWGPAR